MSTLRPLRGGCQCGRNRYIIAVPQNGINEAQVLFNTESAHHETHALIRRVYTHPSQQYSKRHFCGYCGTPLSYWSENPHTEAEFINLTLGSLLREDLRDLEDMGLIPEEEDDEARGSQSPAVVGRNTALRQSYGVPWFDGMVEGTRLGNMRRSQGVKQSHDGRVKVEWEIVEYSNSDESMDQTGGDNDVEMTHPGKRKLQDRDDSEAAAGGN
ncbi:Mss4-like protein [Fusarium austroafricanum]|uniref:Mss4-like protein n=1 Tax=Fusarium austroafricanum TaxID=2364996 RepID=A0A8H4KXT3_9HYPO|nr:Mss4-like protein [Fusarium austroafricanum]